MLDYIKILKYSYYGQHKTNLLLSILTVEKFRGKRIVKKITEKRTSVRE